MSNSAKVIDQAQDQLKNGIIGQAAAKIDSITGNKNLENGINSLNSNIDQTQSTV